MKPPIPDRYIVTLPDLLISRGMAGGVETCTQLSFLLSFASAVLPKYPRLPIAISTKWKGFKKNFLCHLSQYLLTRAFCSIFFLSLDSFSAVPIPKILPFDHSKLSCYKMEQTYFGLGVKNSEAWKYFILAINKNKNVNKIFGLPLINLLSEKMKVLKWPLCNSMTWYQN